MQPLRLRRLSGCCRSSWNAKCIAALGSLIGWSRFLCCVWLSWVRVRTILLLWMEDQPEDQSDHFLWLSHCHSRISIDSIDSHYPASNSISSSTKSEEMRLWLEVELLITLHPRIYIERVSPSSVIYSRILQTTLSVSNYIPLESRPRSIVLPVKSQEIAFGHVVKLSSNSPDCSCHESRLIPSHHWSSTTIGGYQ